MFSILYITAKNKSEAEKLARVLLKAKLIACANIFPIKSQYWWKDKIQSHDEYAIILKTKKKLVKDVIKNVKKHHSYDVPCVIAMPIISGNKDYLKWIGDETR